MTTITSHTVTKYGIALLFFPKFYSSFTEQSSALLYREFFINAKLVKTLSYFKLTSIFNNTRTLKMTSIVYRYNDAKVQFSSKEIL